LSGRRWLLTGAGGQLGRSLQASPLPSGVEWVSFPHADLDISDAAAVCQALDLVKPEVVVNAAAFTQVDACETERELAWQVNAVAPGVLARSVEPGVPVVHLSTEYVFGGEAARPIAEDAPLGPKSAYGESKAAGEAAVREATTEHLIIRTQWLFGEGRNFVRTILAAARRGQPLRVVEDQLGRPTSTDALAAGILQLLGAQARGTLHLACEGIASWFDLATEIVSIGAELGLTGLVPVEPVSSAAFPRPAHRPAYGVLGLERARSQGVQMPHWRTALRTYLEREGGVDA